jgi:hypothetical protein
VTVRRDEYERDPEDEVAGEESEDECSGVTTFQATIRSGADKIGESSLVLVDRAQSFHMTCDERSGELAGVAAFLCDRSGKADHKLSIHGHDRPGKFLYIQHFRVDANHRPANDFTRVGAEALRAILSHPELKGSWTLAAYVPDSAAQMTDEERKKYRKYTPQEEETRAMQEESQRCIRRCCQKDARQFFRAGFRQATPPSPRRGDYYHLFAVPEFAGEGNVMMANQEAISMSMVDPPKRPPPPVGLDSEIHSLMEFEMSMGISTLMVGGVPPPPDLSTFEKRLRELVAKGGAIERANAIHSCARFGDNLAHLDILLKVSGAKSRQAINAKNDEGLTPLMLAAQSATSCYLLPNPYSQKTPSPVGICDKLIARGADKGLTDDVTGLTALGHARKKAVEGMRYSGGYRATMNKLEPLTRLLMPVTGPSPADNTMLNVAQESPGGFEDVEDDGDY